MSSAQSAYYVTPALTKEGLNELGQQVPNPDHDITLGFIANYRTARE